MEWAVPVRGRVEGTLLAVEGEDFFVGARVLEDEDGHLAHVREAAGRAGGADRPREGGHEQADEDHDDAQNDHKLNECESRARSGATNHAW